MKLQEARQLIKRTFENPFNKEHFTYFISNLLKDEYEEKPFTQTGAHLPDAFAAYIRKMERIGKYEDETGNIIDILLVELKKDHSIEWARTTQRNFIRRYLNGSRGGELKDAAIVAFYTEGSEDWRFSLIKMQYSLEKKKDELTPAKRFSFLVGKNEKSHTAQKQLTGLLTMDTVPTLADIESSFNIETVTREFFEKYKDLFLRVNDFFEKQFEKNRELRKELQAKHIDHISFTKKLLGQIVFLYFLQKKGWLGVPKDGKWGEGDKRFLRSLLEKAISSKKIFYTDYLQYLFYEALAEERRNAADPSYYRLLDCKIPFLNGGLFEADYDWKSINVKIPNDYFTNENITKEGDVGDGILDVFDRYNFTVKEDEPLEKEVAVDPEMLGKVFENLLEVTDRKSKGAFYTPREIVHYMCQESLINYLDTTLNNNPVSYQKLGTEQTDMFGNNIRKGQLPLEAEHGTAEKVPKKDLEKFIREGTAAIDNDARVEKAGKETDRYSYQLPETIRNYAPDIDKALADIRVCDPAIGSGAFPVGIMNEIVKAREILTTYLPANKQKDRTAYELKRHCIQECIYGVDIDHSAVDIAKLRLWLSLVVDEEDFYKIKPLPNLDYKIIEGNSLINLPSSIVKNDIAEKELERLKQEFFSKTNLSEKSHLRTKINNTISKLLTTANQFLSYEVNFDFKLYFSEVFHEKKGFDIIIGNPPYVRVQNLTHELIDLYKSNWTTAWKRIDISTLFFELGYSILNPKGHICFISSNQFLKAEYGRNVRSFLKGHVKMNMDYSKVSVFEGLATYVSIFLISRQYSDKVKYKLIENFEDDITDFIQFDISTFSHEPWDFNTNQGVKEKIFKNTSPLSEVANFTYGVITGFDKAFLVKNEVVKEFKLEKAIVKKFIRPQNYKKYHTSNLTYFLIYPYNKDNDVFPETILKKDYPNCYAFLKDYKDELNNRKDSRTTIKEKGIAWYSLMRRVDLNEIDSDKIVFYDVGMHPNFILDKSNCIFGGGTSHSLRIKDGTFNSKYVLGLLNSKLLEWVIYDFCPVKMGNARKYGLDYMKKLPIKAASPAKQKSLIDLVDKIIDLKNADPATSTSKLERQIDIMVFHLYNLTYEEAKIIDPELSEVEFAKYKNHE